MSETHGCDGMPHARTGNECRWQWRMADCQSVAAAELAIPKCVVRSASGWRLWGQPLAPSQASRVGLRSWRIHDAIHGSAYLAVCLAILIGQLGSPATLPGQELEIRGVLRQVFQGGGVKVEVQVAPAAEAAAEAPADDRKAKDDQKAR
ncbi:MAG: hypothetical protein ACKO38_20360, partial [Planctomycetota bacterium]